MMWLLPAAVAVLAALPIVIAVRRVVAETFALRRELTLFSELRPALVELRSEAQMLRDGMAARANQLPRRYR